MITGKQLIEPGADAPVIRVVTAVRGQHHVDVEKEHRSLTRVEVQVLIENLVQGPVRGQVQSRPGAGAALEHRDRWPGATIVGGGKFAAKGVTADPAVDLLTTIMFSKLSAAW